MGHTRIKGSELSEDYLNAHYYSPEFLSNDSFLARCGYGRATIESLSERINCGATPKDVVYELNGSGLIRTTDVRPNQFFAEKVLRTRRLNLSPSSATAAVPGDVVYTMSGTVGYAATIPTCCKEIFGFSNTIARARIRKETDVDSHYVSAFFNSKFGYLQSRRLVSGGIQGHVMPNPFKKLLVVTPHPLAQRYIGAKVRQAERLREFSTSFAVDLNILFSLTDFTPLLRGSKHHRCKTQYFNPERLDAPFYSPEHLQLEKALRSTAAVPLGTYCQLVTDRWKKREPEFLYFEIGSLDIGSGRTSPVKTKTCNAASRAQRLSQTWDVLVSTVRPNRKNVGVVTQESSDGLPFVVSTGFAVLRFENKESAAFFHAWLRSDVATQQLVQWNAGGSYPAIEENVVPRILCPAFSEETIHEVGSKCVDCIRSGDLSVVLCESATLLVEALIERRVSDDVLVNAIAKIEQGDTSADRELLGRLYEGGLDALETRPLFPDLDSYYETLGMVEREQREVSSK